MKFRKVTAVVCLLAMTMASVLGGCGNGSANGESDAGNETSGQENSTGYGENSGDIVTLRVWGYGDAGTDDMKEISEKISEITREKIGVNVDLYRSLDFEKLNLALSSGEKMDLVNVHGLTFTTVVAAGQIIPLDDLYNEYAKEAGEMIDPEELKANMIDGKLYSLPQNNDNARASGFAMRKDIVDALGIDVSEVITMDDVHDVLVQVKEAYPDMYPLVPTWAQGGKQSIFHIDDIGPDYLGVLENAATDSTKVVNLYETEEYQNFVKTMYQWNQEGLIMPDATTTTDNNPIGTVGFASMENIKPGKALEIKKAAGVDVVFAEITPAIKTTSIVAGTWGIAAACEYPEKAMELWNLMYTDPEVSNLFINGLEGKHYVYTDNTGTMIKLPENASEGNTGYTSIDWAWPNCLNTPVWEGGDSDQWEQLDAFNKTSVASPALGFRFDSTNVMNEITACANVSSKYRTALEWGVLNPEETLPVFIGELREAGMDTVTEEVQRQLDVWISEYK